MFFFFFDGFKDYDEGIAPSLVAESFSANNNDIRERLLKETEKQGLRNSDIAHLTGWRPSKISKLSNGNQRLTEYDVKVWARALGYTPDPFIDSSIDIRHYNLRSYIRNVSDTLRDYVKHFEEKDPKHSPIITYELPLAILATLGVNPSDYVVRCVPSYAGISEIGIGIGYNATSVRFWHRSLSSTSIMRPEFGLWVSPEDNCFIWAVYINWPGPRRESVRDSHHIGSSNIRSRKKDLLQVNDEATRSFDRMADKYDWISKELEQGEIVSIAGKTNELPDSESTNDTLTSLFKDYCKLVWEMRGLDLLPDHMKKTESEEISSSKQCKIFSHIADFAEGTKEYVRKRENFKCENGESHITFTDATGRPYMDVVPLVPFSEATRFGMISKFESNGVCLCPVCAKQLQYGTVNDREDMIYKLYRKHQKNLKKSGVEMSLTQVLTANGLG